MSVSGTGAGESFLSHAARSLTPSWGGMVVRAVVGGAAAYAFGQMDASWAERLGESVKKSHYVRYAIGAVGGLLVSQYLLNSVRNLSKHSSGSSGDNEAESELGDVRIKLNQIEGGYGGHVFSELPITQRIHNLVEAFQQNRVVTAQEKWALEDENKRLNELVTRTAKCLPMTSIQIATFILKNKNKLEDEIKKLPLPAQAQVTEHLEVQNMVSVALGAGGGTAVPGPTAGSGAAVAS